MTDTIASTEKTFETVDEFLSHYGVKGMKWGQRRAAKREAKAERKAWLKDVRSEETANKVFQEAAKSFGPLQKAINNDPAFKGKDLTKNPGLARAYDTVVNDAFNSHLANTSIQMTVNKAGDRAMVYQFDRNLGMMRANEYKRASHAATDEFPDFVAEMNALGHIISFELAEPLKQSAQDAYEFLSHYGVKGMKWGKRRTPQQLEEASEDAKRVSGINTRVKTQKSTKMLSNKELQDAITRMNLEQQYSRMSGGLDKTKRQKAAGFVTEMVKNAGKQTVQQVVTDEFKSQAKNATKRNGNGS